MPYTPHANDAINAMDAIDAINAIDATDAIDAIAAIDANLLYSIDITFVLTGVIQSW